MTTFAFHPIAPGDEPPTVVDPAARAPATPRQRVDLAAELALDAVLRVAHVARTQQGIPSPVVLVAVADCALGRSLIDGILGPAASAALSGPAVIALAERDVHQRLGARVHTEVAKALRAASADEVLVAFAVNAMSLELRALRAVPAVDTVAAEHLVENDAAREPARKANSTFASGHSNGAASDPHPEQGA